MVTGQRARRVPAWARISGVTWMVLGPLSIAAGIHGNIGAAGPGPVWTLIFAGFGMFFGGLTLARLR